ncbi:hypothetical protein BS47DRAFT_1401953 [Hydnum rufescens UP504]|uniref:Uncharacterized protein n=1 Tax=Hydnum rufescens UP504 TaxID=1448309 RepID=A0A9P6ADR9_9AGAM|nr:hypothetical protein BS47DRAFT_1401953 [Hydnum rufescens UP504]
MVPPPFRYSRRSKPIILTDVRPAPSYNHNTISRTTPDDLFNSRRLCIFGFTCGSTGHFTSTSTFLSSSYHRENLLSSSLYDPYRALKGPSAETFVTREQLVLAVPYGPDDRMGLSRAPPGLSLRPLPPYGLPDSARCTYMLVFSLLVPFFVQKGTPTRTGFFACWTDKSRDTIYFPRFLLVGVVLALRESAIVLDSTVPVSAW